MSSNCLGPAGRPLARSRGPAAGAHLKAVTLAALFPRGRPRSREQIGRGKCGNPLKWWSVRKPDFHEDGLVCHAESKIHLVLASCVRSRSLELAAWNRRLLFFLPKSPRPAFFVGPTRHAPKTHQFCQAQFKDKSSTVTS